MDNNEIQETNQELPIENPFTQIPVVSPLVRRVEALEFTDPQIPGNIIVDGAGKLLKSWIEMESIIGSHVETYDNWIINVIKRQLANRPIRIPQGEVTVMNPVFFPPRISTAENSWIPLTPQMARDNGYTYSSEIYVDYVLNAGTPQEERLNQNFFGKIPVMLSSVLCHLRGKTQKELTELGECVADPFGYFIIKGAEKVVLTQEKLRVNRMMLYHPSSKDAIVCKMTCSTINGSSNVTIAQGKKSKALKIHLAFMGRSKGKANKIGNTISVFQIYRMLGVKNPNQILQLISLFTKKEYIKKIWVQLQPSFVKLAQVGDDIEHVSKKKGLGNMDYGIKVASIMKDLKNELFPQIPPENIMQKLYMLSIMVARYSEYMIGERKLDDRDNWGNKRLENAGRSLEQLFGNIWREVVTKAQDTIDTKNLQGLQAVKREINTTFIIDNFVSSFNSNNWGVQGSYMPKENITDSLKRDAISAVYSHLTKINTPTNRRAKQAKIRLVQMSQLGFVCVTGDTLINVNGSSKKISELKNGDTVLTVNPNDLTEELSEIKNFFSILPDKLLEITVVSGRKIKCTPDHPFLVKGSENYEWIRASELNLHDNIVIKADNREEYRNMVSYLHDVPLETIATITDNFGFVGLKPLSEGKIAVAIISINEVPIEPVYDFETVHSNHSFIANGFVTHNCPAETPEGEQCGLVKNAALTLYISIERNENIVLEHIAKFISNTPTEQLNTPVIFNGKFLGWAAGEALRNFCVDRRRKQVIHKDTCIVLDYDGYLYIYTDGARPTRPLLIIDPTNNELVIKNKGLWTADMKTLMDEGCVEYIDAWEQEFIQLSQTMGDIDVRRAEIEEATRYHQEAIEKLAQLEGQTEQTTELKRTMQDARELVSQANASLLDIQSAAKYTHCELDPTAIYGIAASLVPLSNHIQGPRTVFTCAMEKQALGIYHSQHHARFDTTAKCLAYPSRPLFQTQMDEILGLNQLPAGDMVTVAIMTYTGYNQEDSIIMNQASIDRGLFRQVIYKSYKSVQKRTRTTTEEFARPTVKKGEQEERYAAIDERGIPRLGSFVRAGDALIGKIRTNIATGSVENASTYVGVGQEGIIDRVLVSTNPEGMRVVKVKIRQIRKPIMGDKLASRYAQKATVGLILPPEDMPFTADGMIPDLVINPHCLPSRMTIAKLIEIVTSKLATFTGERVNATAFRKFDLETFKENLRQYGYSPSGKERMFSGFTGKPFEALIFKGPCFYQVLRHHVLDKIQMRAKGTIKQLSHQPVGGRAIKGGQRFGEMERDAIISHGASAFLQERLCTVSDAYQTIYCSKCGTIAIANNASDKFVCRTCIETGTFGTCTIPYAYKLLTHMLAGAGFNLQFGMSTAQVITPVTHQIAPSPTITQPTVQTVPILQPVITLPPVIETTGGIAPLTPSSAVTPTAVPIMGAVRTLPVTTLAPLTVLPPVGTLPSIRTLAPLGTLAPLPQIVTTPKTENKSEVQQFDLNEFLK